CAQSEQQVDAETQVGDVCFVIGGVFQRDLPPGAIEFGAVGQLATDAETDLIAVQVVQGQEAVVGEYADLRSQRQGAAEQNADAIIRDISAHDIELDIVALHANIQCRAINVGTGADSNTRFIYIDIDTPDIDSGAQNIAVGKKAGAAELGVGANGIAVAVRNPVKFKGAAWTHRYAHLADRKLRQRRAGDRGERQYK